MNIVRKHILLFFSIIFLNACSTLKQPNNHVTKDPYQGLNRSIYSFNNNFDKNLVKPVASGYKTILPGGVRKSVGHFFFNLTEPLNAANNLLQGDLPNTLGSSGRFFINSTAGVFGLFDVAEVVGIKKDPEDLGQTLASWGVQPGPYLMLPFLGPSNLRDSLALVGESIVYDSIDIISDNNSSDVALRVLNLLNIRSDLLDLDKLLEAQLDPYMFLKLGYENTRLNAIYDGKPPLNPDDDFDDF